MVFAGCFTQYFFAIFGATEFCLLTSMSYDRQVAICKPLHYTTMVSNSACTSLVLCSWTGAFLIILFPNILTTQLDFCASNVLNHYFCASGPLAERACSVRHKAAGALGLCLGSHDLESPLLLVSLSYTRIIRTILKIPSTQQRETFATRSAHMAVLSSLMGAASSCA